MAFDSYSGCNIELDISVAHPWNKDILSQAADEDGIGAPKRKVSKNKKYSSELDVWGNSSNCIPLVFEHFGRWGWKADQFLHELSDQSRGKKNSSEFMTYWRRCFSVTLQHYNARVSRRKLEDCPHF